MNMEFGALPICRICLQGSDNEMISIYEKDIEEDLCLYEKIEMCGNIKLTTDPELPSNICNKCNVFLMFAFKFHVICRNSNSYLENYGLKGIEAGGDIDFPDTDFLVEYNPINDAEDDQERMIKNEFWEELETDSIVEFEEDDADDLVSSSKMFKKETAEQQQSLKRKTKQLSKTLDISSDGAAVIRINNAKQLERELKKNQSHICDVCGNVYPKKHALDAHMRRHNNEKHFECEICHNRFAFNFQLTRHIMKHSGARPYNCVYCQRSFTDRSTMKKHERLHRNERPYKCDTCNKTFTYSSVLKVHKLTHTGEKPYICGICGKRFARGHHLRAHLETLLHSKDPQAKILIKQIRPEDGTFEEDV